MLRGLAGAFLAGAILALSGCGSGSDTSAVDPSARLVSLPGAMRKIDFDDVMFSERLGRVLVPARQSGPYLVDPASGKAERVGHLSGADSADEGEGRLFVLDREAGTLSVVDADSGDTVASTELANPGDYVRYAPSRREVWISEP